MQHPWTVAHLSSLPDPELDRLAKQAAAGLAMSKLRLGRVILAMQLTGLPKRLGYKNALHYFKLAGANYVEARECLRVARRCEDLPLLRQAAEMGRVGWTHLREVVRVANAETEAEWIETCRRNGSKAVQKMVKQAKVGQKRPSEAPTGPPAPPCRGATPDATPNGAPPHGAPPHGAPPHGAPPHGSPPDGGRVDLRLKLPAGFNALLGRATRKLSEQAGRQLSPAQVVECLLAHYLTGHAFPGPMMWNRLLGQPSPHPVLGSRESGENSREFSDAPWEAVAATEEPCPGEPSLQLVRPAPAHWEPTETQRHEAFCCACPDCPDHLWLEVHNLVAYCEGSVMVPDNLLVLCASCYSRVQSGRLRVERLTGRALRWFDQNGRDLMDLVPEAYPEGWLDIEDDEYDEHGEQIAVEVEVEVEVEVDPALWEAFWPREEWQYDEDAEDDGADMSAWMGPDSTPRLVWSPARNSREFVGPAR